MFDLLFDDGAIWFTTPAIVGTAFFVLRLVMMTIGLGYDLHLDSDMADLHHGDPGEAFKAISLQGILAFAMGFGWGGLGSLRGSGWSMSTSIGVAVVCGAFMVWLLGILLKAMYDLKASGNINIEAALNRTGTVYANVPPHGQGRGQVRLVVNDRQRIYNAVSDGDAILTNTEVRVVKINQDRTLTVARVST